MGETGRTKDWWNSLLLLLQKGEEDGALRLQPSQGLDIWVALPADLRCGAAPDPRCGAAPCGATSAPRGAVSAGGAGGT
jgi:hypothetical protein